MISNITKNVVDAVTILEPSKREIFFEIGEGKNGDKCRGAKIYGENIYQEMTVGSVKRPLGAYGVEKRKLCDIVMNCRGDSTVYFL